MPEKHQTPAKNWRVAARSTALIVGLAWAAGASRWEPSLSFDLETIDFYLRAPAQSGPGEPPVCCKARVRVANSGTSRVLTSAFDPNLLASYDEWNPPPKISRSMDWNESAERFILELGAVSTAPSWRRVPVGVDRVSFRIKIDIRRPDSWWDRVLRWLVYDSKLDQRASRWLVNVSPPPEWQTFYSPWYEADVPPVSTLQVSDE